MNQRTLNLQEAMDQPEFLRTVLATLVEKVGGVAVITPAELAVPDRQFGASVSPDGTLSLTTNPESH